MKERTINNAPKTEKIKRIGQNSTIPAIVKVAIMNKKVEMT
ncbi:hypothetical protein PSSHI_05870 [Photobacterium sp. R1]